MGTDGGTWTANGKELTAEAEGIAALREIRVSQHIQLALTRESSMADFVSDLIGVHEKELPEHDWSKLRNVALDELADLRTRWLGPFLADMSKRKLQGSLLVGIYNLKSGSHLDDLFLFATPSTAASPYVELPGQAAIKSWAESSVVARLCRAAFEGERCPGNSARAMIVGYAAKAISLLLAGPGAVDGAQQRDVFVGYFHGRPLFVGRVNDSGFVPTPLPVVTARLRERRAAYVTSIRALAGPPVADITIPEVEGEVVRALCHPDGRRWELRVTGSDLHLSFTDSDGDDSKRVRPSQDPLWEAQALVRDQLRDGFVEAGSSR
jgi:hypothetical protein